MMAGNGREDVDGLPEGYVFDVFRVAGGKVHTWSFHGCVSDDFQCNASLKPAESKLAKRYLAEHRKGTAKEGTAPDVLKAVWRLRRKKEVVDGIPLKNAEAAMMRSLYDEKSPRKYTAVSLFGHPNAKVMVANWYAVSARQHNFPFLYLRNEAKNGAKSLDDVYVSIIEPYAGKPFITSEKVLAVKDAGDGALKAVALEVSTAYDRHDILFSSGEPGKVYQVEGGISASGLMSMASADKNGLVVFNMVGGSKFAWNGFEVEIARPAWQSVIKSCNYQRQTIRINQAWPAKILDGEMLTVGNSDHKTAFKITAVKGRDITLNRTARTYTCGIESVADKQGYAVLDLKPYLVNYHPGYYNGMTMVNEAGKILGRIQLKLGERFWYLGWPEARAHNNVIHPGDITDENHDGKKTLSMICETPTRKLKPDGTPYIPVKPGEKMLDLEVTRIRKDGLMFWTKQHPRQFLDAINVPHPGWPYHRQRVVNEKGDKSWIVNMPGDTYQVSLNKGKLSSRDFPDRDGNGRRKVTFYHYGPGDAVSLPTHVGLRRLEPGKYELRADAACTVTLPGSKVSISSDGKKWRVIPATGVSGDRVRINLSLKDLADGRIFLKLDKSAKQKK